MQTTTQLPEPPSRGGIMRVRASLVAAIVITAAVLASTFVFGMRKKWRPVLTVVRRASRATKSIVLKTAGTQGAHRQWFDTSGGRPGANTKRRS